MINSAGLTTAIPISILEKMPHFGRKTNSLAKALKAKNSTRIIAEFKRKSAENLAVDGGGHLTYIAPTRVNLSLTQERFPEVEFSATREH